MKASLSAIGLESVGFDIGGTAASRISLTCGASWWCSWIAGGIPRKGEKRAREKKEEKLRGKREKELHLNSPLFPGTVHPLCILDPHHRSLGEQELTSTGVPSQNNSRAKICVRAGRGDLLRGEAAAALDLRDVPAKAPLREREGEDRLLAVSDTATPHQMVVTGDIDNDSYSSGFAEIEGCILHTGTGVGAARIRGMYV